ncbi:MAG: hypothetical protein QW273_03205 [Candidatus Pacearchaeota archaeon]
MVEDFNKILIDFKKLKRNLHKYYGEREIEEARRIFPYFMKKNYEDYSDKKIINSLNVILYKKELSELNNGEELLNSLMKLLKNYLSEEVTFCLNYCLLEDKRILLHQCKYFDIDEMESESVIPKIETIESLVCRLKEESQKGIRELDSILNKINIGFLQ